MQTDKREEILGHLKDVEREHDVKVLYAVESGSRAWGFESANSDWDVRLIFVHKPQWYLSVKKQRDVIEGMYDDGVDLAGWDLKKALTLLLQSNPSLFEWLHSPIVYCADDIFLRRIREVESGFFNPTKMMFHYNHIYLKHDTRYLQTENCKLKRFFYYLRGILACKWIGENLSVPPVPFTELVNATVDDKDMRDKIYDLIALKKSGEEKDTSVIDKDLLEYAGRLAGHCNNKVVSFCPEVGIAPAETLDALMYDMVMCNSETNVCGKGKDNKLCLIV